MTITYYAIRYLFASQMRLAAETETLFIGHQATIDDGIRLPCAQYINYTVLLMYCVRVQKMTL